MLHDLFRIEGAGLGDVALVAHHFRGRGIEKRDALGCPAPPEVDVRRRLPAMCAEGAPQDLENVMPLGNDEAGDVFGEQLGEGKERDGIGVLESRNVMLLLEPSQDLALFVGRARFGVPPPRLLQ
ncbi:hypothetical protein ABT301_22505 [Streptomyces sp. NPDC000987]|uniref:hypothetical protein n=1 Tax=Streptomyces sp. NPDC000987 TaxID=3154374 RepID=UPI00332A2451